MDNLCNEHIRFAHDYINVLLSNLFNLILSHGYIPSKLMDTIIISLLKDKKGDITSKENYRPIAITCALSKVLEVLVLNKFSEYLATSCHQFGFKKGESTENCLFILKEVIHYYNTLQSPVFLCMIDSSKAFDRVNHFHLFHKLLKKGMPRLVVRMLYFWYRNQLFYVKWNDVLSCPFKTSNGVRQGGVLSPQLFNVFIDDLSNNLMNTSIGCYIHNTCFNHICYADDLVVLAPSPVALQELLNVCEDYAIDYEMLFNARKTVCMKFVPRLFHKIKNPSIHLSGNELNFVNTHKYLGNIISSNSLDDDDIKRQIRSTYTQGNLLVRKFRNCSEDVKSYLFKTYCYNMYNCQLWCAFTATTMKRMKVAYNNVFRMLMGIKRRCSVSQAYANKNICSFDALLRKCIWNSYRRALCSKNHLINVLVSIPHFNYGSIIFKRWKQCLYANLV